MKRIFVQIASYRDSECAATLEDMFAKAAQPERVFVGVCEQYGDEDRLIAANERVRIVSYPASEAKGAGWARNEAQKLCQSEEYVLQIHAHMRFEQGWDETLIDALENLPTHKAMLTAWLPSYTPPDAREQELFPVATLNRIADEKDAQLVHMIKRLVSHGTYHRPFPTAMWVGNFLFARASLFAEVPCDPHIYFWGEEINFSARAWTHGYDIYHLHKPVLYHYWDRGDVPDARQYRDHHDKRNQDSLARNLSLFGIKKSNQEDADTYGLGTKRALADYWRFIGVDWEKKTLSLPSRHGVYERIFVAIASYRDPETTHTIADLFAKATHPERIFVGVCHQLLPEDTDCAIHTDRPAQVRIKQVDATESQGANWARAEAFALHTGEEYILQIDAHMRFEPHWDSSLIDMAARAPSVEPVITILANRYEPEQGYEERPGQIGRITVGSLAEEGNPQILHLARMNYLETSPLAGLYPSPFVVASFIFASASVWKRVPTDPHIFFYGDEITLSARLFTHGYDIYQPYRNVAYHYSRRADQMEKQVYRNPNDTRMARTYERVRHLLGLHETSESSAVAELGHYSLGKVRSIEDFWRFAGVNLSQCLILPSAKLGQWRERKQLAASKPRIFVQIASYRDPDCQHTVRDLFEKATFPERINVGICWQFIAEEDATCFTVPYPYPEQVRVMNVDSRESKGACWARAQTQTLWQGEEFTLQIDSHMRFVQGWDEELMFMWHQCRSDKAVLSTYAAAFYPSGEMAWHDIPRLCAREFNPGGILELKGTSYDSRNSFLPELIPGAFISGHMLFGPGSLIADVPYDPKLYFYGEEISLAVRLWTHGYDIFNPNQSVVFHQYKKPKNDGEYKTHFSDHQEWWKLNDVSFARVRHLLGTETISDPRVLEDLERYSLGKVRSLKDYERYSGVYFATKTITDKAEKGQFSASYNAKILVRIASYRDTECQYTIRDLFEKAANPDRVFVALCWQFDHAEDAGCFRIETRKDQVRTIAYDWRQSNGVCFARAQTEQFWQQEEYTLQIDSHMRFVEGWDDALIAELAMCHSPKAVLSSSPAPYTPPNQLTKNPLPTVRRVLPFARNGNIRGRGEMLEREPETPLRGAFVAAGFMFARSDILREIPYDPYLYFDQEEIMLAIRLFTHGWDVYSPRKQYLYHYYNKPKDTTRPLHWNDLRAVDEGKLTFLQARGLARFNHLSGFAPSHDPNVLIDIEKYGLGLARSLQEFEAFTGIDFRQKVVSPKALTCGFIEGIERYRSTPFVPDRIPPSQLFHPPKPYDVGDRIPLFIAADTHGKHRGIEAVAGRPSVLFLLSAHDVVENAPFFHALHAVTQKAGSLDGALVFIFDAPVEHLAAFKQRTGLPHVLLSDPERRIAQGLGVQDYPAGFLLSPDLQIKRRYSALAPSALVEQAITDMQQFANAPRASGIMTSVAPVLMVPEIFSPAFCDELVTLFSEGERFSGMVGADPYISAKNKMRKDFIVPEGLRHQIDEILARRLFSEIEKVYGFSVTARENYKIAMYDSSEGGHFSKHRDNFDPALGYRRIAMTLSLSDDYEGGGIRFPEYDDRVYRPAKGSAIAFSCSMSHEACTVTQGQRHILLGFFHGEQEEAYRRQYALSHGLPVEAAEFQIASNLPLLPTSRDFLRRRRN